MKTRSVPDQASSIKGSTPWIVIIALLSVYIFWGGTYLGMKVAIETMPPFWMAGTRFLIAGGVLYVLARMQGEGRPSAREWRGAGIVGALLLLGGNGMVAWAEQRVPSAIASMLVATVPLWIIAFNWAGSRKAPGIGTIAGVILGFTGIVILVSHTGGESDKSLDAIGLITLVIASICWSAGSMYSRRARLPKSPMMSTAVQMLVGGALLLIASYFTGDWSKLHLSDISLRSYLALGYLIFFGSICGYTAYIWLLKNADPTWVSTYAFVNPIVALFLGWCLADEQLTVNSLAASVIIIAAVIVITVFGRKPQSSTARTQPSNVTTAATSKR